MRNGPSATSVLVLSMGILAFVSWFMFFIVFKIRGDFYFFETSQMQLPISTAAVGAETLHDYRPPATALGILRDESGRLSLLFEDGKLFRYPEQLKEVESYLKLKSQRLEFTALLTKSPSRTIGRVQVWVDRSTSFVTIREVFAMLTRIGFDEFDLAMLRGGSSKNSLDKTAMLKERQAR
jgi:hypothetical protein